MKRFLTLALLVFMASHADAAGPANTLASIKASKTITLAFAPDAAPFSFTESYASKPEGFSIALCERMVDRLREQLGLAELKIKWMVGTTPGRLEMVANGKADMECGVTTATLKRQEKVDFSNTFFLQSAGVLTRAGSGITTPAALAGKKIAVLAGTTAEKRLAEALDQSGISAELLSFKTRDEALKALSADQVQALAGDKLLLVGLAARDKSDTRLSLMDQEFSVEPYAFALRRGDPNFRLAVNRALGQTYRSGELGRIFERWLAPLRPSELLVALYGLSSMEE